MMIFIKKKKHVLLDHLQLKNKKGAKINENYVIKIVFSTMAPIEFHRPFGPFCGSATVIATRNFGATNCSRKMATVYR